VLDHDRCAVERGHDASALSTSLTRARRPVVTDVSRISPSPLRTHSQDDGAGPLTSLLERTAA